MRPTPITTPRGQQPPGAAMPFGRLSPALRRDPVCGMAVTARTAAGGTVLYNGVRYGFCSHHCHDRFIEDPARYLDFDTSPEVEARDVASAWTCLLHPEVVSPEPGECPTCGEALEPVVPPRDSVLASRALEQRLVAAIGLSSPVLLLAMGARVPAFSQVLDAPSFRWLVGTLATGVVFGAGWPLLQKGARSLKAMSPDGSTLVSLAVLSAWALSVVALVVPEWFPSTFLLSPGRPPLYFDSAAVVTTLVLLLEVLEARAKGKANQTLAELSALLPSTAVRVTLNGDEELPAGEVRPGDLLRLRPGDRVPVDGLVLQGQGAADEEMVTGEPSPSEKLPGSRVLAGTVNVSGRLAVRAERVGHATLLASMVRQVAAAGRSKAPTQKAVERFCLLFVPAVLLIALFTLAGWALGGGAGRLASGVTAALSVLVVACPGALLLATPMALVVGLGRAAKTGVLFRSAFALERLGRVDTLVVDKTGTLTEGRPRLVELHVVNGFDPDTALRMAASLERESAHPLARAILEGAAGKGLVLGHPTEVVEVQGRGLTGKVRGRVVALGTPGWLTALGVRTAALESLATRWRAQGRGCLMVAIDGHVAGLLGVEDPVRPSAMLAVEELQRQGVEVVLCTSDHPVTARLVAQRLGVERVLPDLLPSAKREVVAALSREGRVVALAGDAASDQAALAAADVGVALGAGGEAALTPAGVTLVGGDLSGLLRARELSLSTMKRVRRSLVAAFGYHLVAVPLAAGALYPVLGTVVSPMLAGAAMSLSAAAVLGSALRKGRSR